MARKEGVVALLGGRAVGCTYTDCTVQSVVVTLSLPLGGEYMVSSRALIRMYPSRQVGALVKNLLLPPATQLSGDAREYLPTCDSRAFHDWATWLSFSSRTGGRRDSGGWAIRRWRCGGASHLQTALLARGCGWRCGRSDRGVGCLDAVTTSLGYLGRLGGRAGFFCLIVGRFCRLEMDLEGQ